MLKKNKNEKINNKKNQENDKKFNLKLIIISIIIFLILVLSTYFLLESSRLDELTGEFNSKRGVLSDISFVCFNSGYLTTDSGVSYPICLEENVDIKCDKVKLFGSFNDVEINSEKLQNKKLRVFFVENFKCE